MRRQVVKTVLCTVGLIAVMGFGPCSSSVSGPVKYGGYVINMATRAAVTGYVMEIETADGKTEADLDDDTGKFEFSTPVGVDYVVKVTKDGFRTFLSTNQRAIVNTSASSQEVMELNEHQKYVYNVPFIPTSMVTPEISGQVVDAGNGAAITSGAFRVASTSLSTIAGLYTDGTASGTRWWANDAPVLASTLADGTFTIPANTLLPGYTYDIVVFGVTGYRDKTASLSISSTSINTTPKITIEMFPYTNPGAPLLIGQSNMHTAGAATTVTPIPLGSDRTITLTFDRNITLNKTGLKGHEIRDLLTLNAATDDDGDGDTTGDTGGTPGVVTEAALAADAYTSLLTVTSSGNKVMITLAADDDLIANSDVDEDDDLSYTLNSGVLLANIKVRDAGSQYDADWVALSAITPQSVNTTVMIRGNYP